jgi:predicted dehydrogenase
MNRLRMAVVGVGHLGQAHARILASMSEIELVGVVDTNYQQAELVANRHQTKAFTDYSLLFDRIDAVSIVVPTTYHHQVAKAFLEKSIPVLVEKPITISVEEADELITLAEKKQVPFQVGHIERFNPAFEELSLRRIQPKLVECERHGPFTGRSTDIGAVLDLMIHDLDLLLTLNGDEVQTVQAIGAAVFGGHEDVVNARLTFANGCVAHVTASRVSPKPKRKLRIWAPEGYAGIDFVDKRLTLVQSSEELRRNGLRVPLSDPKTRARLKEEIFHKHLQSLELDCNRGPDQLTKELQDFSECVRTHKQPRVTGKDGRAALRLAHRILESCRFHSWNADPNGPTGLQEWPEPLGPLFEIPMREAA